MLILASESPRRRELLKQLGADFEIIPAAVEEFSDGDEPEKLPEKNALLKARHVAERFPEAFVLGADTGVFDTRKMLGKPRSREEALAMLLSLSGRSHQVISGVALLSLSRGICRSWSVRSQVTFRGFTPADAELYMEKVNVMDKAGAYAIQDHAGILGAVWEGELENIIGLPLTALTKILREYDLLPPEPEKSF